MPLPYAQMIVMPGHGAGRNLLVHTLVGNERDITRPPLKIEQLRVRRPLRLASWKQSLGR